MNLVNVGIAFVAGLISITSPCCLPLLPGHLGYLTGMAATGGAACRRRVLPAAVLFVSGFTAVFAALGATASSVGALLLHNRAGLERVAGFFVIFVGLLLLTGGRIPLLNRQGDWAQAWARGRLWTAAPLGAAFALTWTPCIGPVLAAILTLASSTDRVFEGAFLLIVYSLGLGIPFLALSLSAHRVHRWLRRAGRALDTARMGAGALLVAMGGLLVTDRWLPLMAPLLRLYAKAQWPPI